MRAGTTFAITSAVGAAFVLGCFVLNSPAAHGAQGCAAEKLKGRYVFSGQGMNLHSGALDFDGNGSFAGKQTSVRHPLVSQRQREALHGAYTLEADCTGVMVMEGQLGGTAHWDIFVTEDGKKGRMIRTDAGAAGIRTFEQ
jgi:hypothetical protein